MIAITILLMLMSRLMRLSCTPTHTDSNYTATYTTERTADDLSSTDEYCSTYSSTGDSGFSDSRAFLRELPPQQRSAQIEHVLDSGASYTPLITAGMHGAKYYKSLNQENRIPGICCHEVHIRLPSLV